MGPEALYQITRAEYKTEPDNIKIKDLIRLYTEHYLPKRNTYHNRGDFFWAKQWENETPKEFWRRLIEIEKECSFGTISAEELLISKYMTAITDKKLRDKPMKEKTVLEMKKTFEMIKQNTYEMKNKRNTKPEALITTKEKQTIKEEQIQRMIKFGTRPKTRTTGNRPCRFCNAPNWSPIHKCPAQDSNCNDCGNKGHYARVCKQRIQNKRTVRKLTEERQLVAETKSSKKRNSVRYLFKFLEKRHNRKSLEGRFHSKIQTAISGTKNTVKTDTGRIIHRKFILGLLFQSEKRHRRESAPTVSAEMTPKNRHCLRGLDNKYGKRDEILRDILNGKLRIEQNKKQTETETEDEDYDDDDEEEMPEEAGKTYDTSERGGRYAPIRTNPENDATQIHTDGRMPQGENTEKIHRQSNRNTNRPNRYGSIY